MQQPFHEATKKTQKDDKQNAQKNAPACSGAGCGGCNPNKSSLCTKEKKGVKQKRACMTMPRYWLFKMKHFVLSSSTAAVASSWQFIMKLRGLG